MDRSLWPKFAVVLVVIFLSGASSAHSKISTAYEFKHEFLSALKALDPIRLAKLFSSKAESGACSAEADVAGKMKAANFLTNEFSQYGKDSFEHIENASAERDGIYRLLIRPSKQSDDLYLIEVEKKTWIAKSVVHCKIKQAENEPEFRTLLMKL